jgi:transposase
LSRRKFAEFLGKQKPSLVAFESCASAHYWARTAQRHGHEARIIPAKAVATVEQQGLQAIHRSRELLIQESTALSNHLRGLLMEFGLVMPKGFASLMKAVPEILEDGDDRGS